MATDRDAGLVAAPAQVADALGLLLLRGNRVHLYSTLTADHRDVDETLYPVLSGLARLGPVTATELAAHIGLDRTVTTRYATRLEAAGLIERRGDEIDARRTSLVLTGRGTRTVAAMRRRLDELIADAMSGWSARESATFARLFGELADNLVRPGSPAPAPSDRRP